MSEVIQNTSYPTLYENGRVSAGYYLSDDLLEELGWARGVETELKATIAADKENDEIVIRIKRRNHT